MPELVAISRIVLDPELQPRLTETRAVILDYARALRDGAQFPPVTVFDVKGELLLADGYHRVGAHKHERRSEILVDIRQGSRLNAFRFAREYNMAHGYRLNRAEVQRAIRHYLERPELAVMLDRYIGRCLRVDGKTVAAQRRALDKATQRAVSPKVAAAPVAHPVPVERTKQTQARALIAAYHVAVDALTAAEGADQVQTEIIKWWSAISGSGAVKFEQPTRPHRGTRVVR